MLNVGRVCLKIAGKDAGKTVVVVDQIDNSFVLIDGPVKRKRCNIFHLEPLSVELKIKKNASHEDVVKELQKLDIIIPKKTAKTKKATEKPQKKRRSKREPSLKEPHVVKKQEKKTS